MSRTSLLHTFLFLFLVSILHAQDVNSLQKKFPDASVVKLESVVEVSFKIAGDGKLVAVVEKTESYISLKSSAQYTFAEFYDEYSDIKKLIAPGLEQDEFYQSNNIFHSDTRVKYNNMSFGKVGSIKEASSVKQYNDMRYISSFYVPSSIPCVKKTIKIEIPDDAKIDILPFYLDENKVLKRKHKTKKGNMHTYIAENVEAYDDSPGLPGHSYIYPHLLVLPKSYTYKGERVNLFSNTKDQYKWYRSLVNSIGNDNSSLKKLVAELTGSASTEKEKMENIFYWVQDNIRYIAFEDGIAGFKPESCQNVFDKKYGDCKGMANLMKEMLLIAGIDARLCWIGTKQVVYGYDIPSLLVDNHMICAVKQADDFIFLDGTEKFINIDNYAERIQNQEALIEDGNSFILKRIPKAESNDNKMTLALNLDLVDKTMSGDVKASFTGESKSNLKYKMAATQQNRLEDAAADYLKYGNENVSIDAINVSEFLQKEKESKIEAKIELREFANTFGDETYLYIDPFKIYDNYDFEEDRKYEYWFDHKIKDIVNIKLNIGNRTVSSLPESIQINNPEFIISADYSQQNNIINYDISIEIPDAKISKKNIGSWNKAISQIKEFYEQPIILKDK